MGEPQYVGKDTFAFLFRADLFKELVGVWSG